MTTELTCGPIWNTLSNHVPFFRLLRHILPSLSELTFPKPEHRMTAKCPATLTVCQPTTPSDSLKLTSHVLPLCPYNIFKNHTGAFFPDIVGVWGYKRWEPFVRSYFVKKERSANEPGPPYFFLFQEDKSSNIISPQIPSSSGSVEMKKEMTPHCETVLCGIEDGRDL